MVQGLDITIENPRGSIRKGVDKGGNEWAVAMAHDYGYIRRTLGVDGDHFDVLLGPNSAADTVWVVTTKGAPDFTEDDEQKAMIGFNSEDEAMTAFAGMYDDPRFRGAVVAMPMAEFKAKVRTTREDPRMLKGMMLLLKAQDHGKLSASMRAKIGTVGSKHREDMPADAFLEGKERKYPVKTRGDDGGWHYSPKLLQAAAERARMEGRADLAAEAERISASL
jgi:hypothetical protein